GVAITGALGRLQTARAARGAIVVVTDGASNTGSPLPDEAARLAARQGMTVIAVGVGREGLVPFPTELGVVEIPLGIDEPALRRAVRPGLGSAERGDRRRGARSHRARRADRHEPEDGTDGRVARRRRRARAAVRAGNLPRVPEGPAVSADLIAVPAGMGPWA